jgi:two-component system sensor histidine kinase QseC
MTRRSPSLAWRLTLMTAAFVVAVWGVTMAVVWTVTRHELNELLDAHLAQTASLLASGEVEDDDRDDAPQTPPTREHTSKVAFQIWHKGRLVARSAHAPDSPLADTRSRGLSERVIDGVAWRVFTAVRGGDKPGKHDKKGQSRPGDDSAEDLIHVGERVAARNDVLIANLRGMVVSLLAMPLLALGIAWVVRRALQPLRALGLGVARRQPQALDPLPEDGAPPEVLPLVRALNDLFARVAEQLASERRFTADAAHELRTPIAAIRMQAQVAQGAADAAERATALAATIAGCDRATRLVEQLLQLARLEADDRADAERAPGLPAEPARADLNALAADGVRQLLPQAAARGQHIAWQPHAGPLPVALSPALAAVLLRNLLDNALRYSPDGARVQVRVASPAHAESGAGTRAETGGEGEPGGACLTVEDSGPGLPPESRARLGERFFRQLGTGQSGSGLGWSIVRRVARLHGLRVEVDHSPTLGGLRVRVIWPAGA